MTCESSGSTLTEGELNCTDLTFCGSLIMTVFLFLLLRSSEFLFNLSSVPCTLLSGYNLFRQQSTLLEMLYGN